jgi:hypothetical protein
VKLESSADLAKKRSSKLLAKNAVPVIFSYSKPVGSGSESEGVIVRVDTIVDRLTELFVDDSDKPVQDEGHYGSNDEEEAEKKKKKTKSKL